MSVPASNTDRVVLNNDISLWRITLFGPFYLGYKGYIKEALLLAFVAVIAPVMIVDFGKELV